VIVGSMFSGKSEELIRRVRRAVIARRAVQVFKPAIDIRFNSELVSSHDGDSFEARPVLVGEEVLQLMSPDTTVVGIDEVQFFDHAIVGVVRKLVASGHRHCYRSLRHGPTRLVWAPASAFVDTSKANEGVRLTRRVGYIRYRFDGRGFAHDFVEPPRFINHDLRNWMIAKGSTTYLPARPLAAGA